MLKAWKQITAGGVLMMAACGAAEGAITYAAANGWSGASYWEASWVSASSSFSRDPLHAPDYYVVPANPHDPYGPPLFSYGSASYTAWCRPDRLYTTGSTWVWNTPQLYFSESTASMRLHVEFTTDAEVDFSATLRPSFGSLHDTLLGSLRDQSTEYLSDAYLVGVGSWAGKLGPGGYVLDLAIQSDAPRLGTINDGQERYFGGGYWELSIPGPPSVAWLAAGALALRRRRGRVTGAAR